MPRFFFLISDGDLYEDNEGQEPPGPDAAMAGALTAARELLAEVLKTGRILLREKIVVSDEAGDIVGTIDFRDAVEIDQ